MYGSTVCQRAPARSREATGHELLELAALGGNHAGQRYSGPVALKFGLLGCTHMRGGRSVDPWKQHLPPAPIPASLHGRRVGRDVAVHLGSAASAARALFIGVIGIATRGKCRGIQSYRSSSRNAVDLLFQHQNLRQGNRASQGNHFPIYILSKHYVFILKHLLYNI